MPWRPSCFLRKRQAVRAGKSLHRCKLLGGFVHACGKGRSFPLLAGAGWTRSVRVGEVRQEVVEWRMPEGPGTCRECLLTDFSHGRSELREAGALQHASPSETRGGEHKGEAGRSPIRPSSGEGHPLAETTFGWLTMPLPDRSLTFLRKPAVRRRPSSRPDLRQGRGAP